MINRIDSIDLAYYIINSNKYSNLSHLKIQKLLYYIQSWHLVFFDKKLFDDDFQAWVHGPVSRKIYDAFKDESILHNELSPNPSRGNNIKTVLSDEQLQLINDVLDEYGDKTPYHLECLTHEEKPWKEARGNCSLNEKCTNIINENTIKEYYTSLIS